MSHTLFAMPNWMSGAGRSLDLGGTYDDYNISRTPAEADAVAIALDWYAVGDALRLAMFRHKSDAETQGKLNL